MRWRETSMATLYGGILTIELDIEGQGQYKYNHGVAHTFIGRHKNRKYFDSNGAKKPTNSLVIVSIKRLRWVSERAIFVTNVEKLRAKSPEYCRDFAKIRIFRNTRLIIDAKFH